MDFQFLYTSFVTLLRGVPLTLELSLYAVFFGGILGLFLTVLRLSGIKILAFISEAYVFAFRGTPLLVQIFLIYYGLAQFRPFLQELGLWSFFRDAYWCAVIALSLNTAAYASEIFRGGYEAVPAPQIEAARACGMSGFLLQRRIIFPIAIRQALPAYGNELILMVKATSLASVITMMEITGIAAKLISESFRAVEVFIAAGTVYLLLNFILTRIIAYSEWKLSAHIRPPATIKSASKLKTA
ncbi:ABC transporter permease [Ochrobactrum sp. MR28]|nr:ABC transporter permease [Ochrobactrum sp. MR28]MBX8818367.1 ABC transporter permease [Ochrobactrum sp. MR31]